MRHLRESPTVLKRWVDGVEGEPFFQKRVPDSAPDWLQTATVTFPSGRSARELVANDAAHLVWGVNLGVIDWNPWPVRRTDLDHPDELRVDLDPGPGVPFSEVREVALVVRDVLEEHELTRLPEDVRLAGRARQRAGSSPSRASKTSGAPPSRSRARSSAGCRRRATSRWWKEEREGVFIDYNQNARDRTVASAYSVRAVPDARVSCPLEWDEVADVEPADLRSRPSRRACASEATPRAASTITPAGSTRCSSSPPATSGRGSATRRGRRTSASRRASRRGCSPAGRGRRGRRRSEPASVAARLSRSLRSRAGSCPRARTTATRSSSTAFAAWRSSTSGEVFLQSRNGRPLGRYFPELPSPRAATCSTGRSSCATRAGARTSTRSGSGSIRRPRAWPCSRRAPPPPTSPSTCWRWRTRC